MEGIAVMCVLRKLFGKSPPRRLPRAHMDLDVQARIIDMLDLEARIESLYKYQTGHPIGDLLEERPHR